MSPLILKIASRYGSPQAQADRPVVLRPNDFSS